MMYFFKDPSECVVMEESLMSTDRDVDTFYCTDVFQVQKSWKSVELFIFHPVLCSQSLSSEDNSL